MIYKYCFQTRNLVRIQSIERNKDTRVPFLQMSREQIHEFMKENTQQVQVSGENNDQRD